MANGSSSHRRAHLSEVSSVRISTRLLAETMEVLREFGTRRCEGMVLWVGEVGDEVAVIGRVLVPPQHAIQSENGVGYLVSNETLVALNRFLAQTKLRLIAQVHSHPGEAYHSSTDDQCAIVTTEGGFSLVVPNFGEAPANPACWAVYRLRGGRWTQLQSRDVQRTFRA